MKNSMLIALLILGVAASGSVFAKRQVTIRNDLGERMYVCAYNGDDSIRWSASSDTYVDAGHNQIMSCEGNDTHRCKVNVHKNDCKGGKHSMNVRDSAYMSDFPNQE